jgi:cellobiose phosphorylase
LNSDFKAVRHNLGRAFGFAFGHKENGAMFSHMAVMYGYALYERGLVDEGFKVLDGIYQHSQDFAISRMYPGIPEYMSDRGRGMYPFLTGSASWYLLALVTQVFGVRGQWGDLLLAPQLVAGQFDEGGNAGIQTLFAGKRLKVVYENLGGLGCGDWEIAGISMAGNPVPFQKQGNGALVRRQVVADCEGDVCELVVRLG